MPEIISSHQIVLKAVPDFYLTYIKNYMDEVSAKSFSTFLNGYDQKQIKSLDTFINYFNVNI